MLFSLGLSKSSLNEQLRNNVMMRFFKQISLPGIIFFIGVLVLLLSLGFWQVTRAKQKQALIEQQQHSMSADRLSMNTDTPDDLALLNYREVTVTGHYDKNHQFLIDNQHVNGKVGYFVLTPLIIAGGAKAVLVNRGWVPLNPDRSVLPALPIQSTAVTIKGRIHRFPSVGVKLAGAETPTTSWPAVVQVVETPVLAKIIGHSLFSFQIELDPQMPEGFLRVWHTALVMTPEKHIAYAVQWFGLAFTFAVLFFWFNYKKTV
jgi:surfeit locus 1 family protein